MSLEGIGSVIPAAGTDDSLSSGQSVWSAWTDGQAENRSYATARAALAALLAAREIKRLWLPAYCCRALAEGAQAAGVELVWYGVDEGLNADLNAVESELIGGDAILAIAWFGRPADAAFQRLAAKFPDLLIIDDRAQALDPRESIQGAVRLYSPRKLLGVADGGILVGRDLPAPAIHAAQTDLWATNDARRADPDGLDPGSWFPAYQAREAAFNAEPRRCSERTLAALDNIDLESESDARKRNWRVLAASLSHLALWSIPDPKFAPLAFPVVISDAAGLAAHLAEKRIWAARHWIDLPSPEHFHDAHVLSRRCVSLPLDSRYGSRDMQRIIDAVLDYTTLRRPQTDGAR